jgi:hypothetical protein
MSDVISWLQSNLLTVVLLVSFFLILSYALWLRYKMRVSKARFALAVVAAMVSCATGLLAFLSGPLPIQIINTVLSGAKVATGISNIPLLPDQSWFTTSLGFSATALSLFLIYKFSIIALKNWEGPVTVNVNELAKREQDNSIALLALAEMRRLLASKADPVASDVAVNWHQKQSDAPSTPPWHLLARQLFESAFSEVIFSETSWRDRFQSWVGEMYVSRPRASDTVPLVLFVFEFEPDDIKLREHVEAFTKDGASLAGIKIFAVFNEGEATNYRIVAFADFQVEIWPRHQLLRKGLNFTRYARDLVKRFDRDVLGGTNATLKDTFVDAHVVHGEESSRKQLSSVLTEWLDDKSRRHLAITGEYGQGKSTAMLEFCVKWAKRYLENSTALERVPLLIELRGQNPAESDPVAFLSAWAGRYGLPPKQLLNLIKAGEAILIFEGFDELRNAGRAYDRHEHFNALWRLAYPGTKLIFTGRPNFFLDEREKNRTLRADSMKGAAGNAFTQLWGLDRLTESEVRQVVGGFGEALGKSIMAATVANPAFFEIVSRPSMLPVVATIWEKIVQLQSQGHALTSAALLEYYLQAIYRRKEEEIERDQRLHATPDGANYLLLPREIREVFTLAIVWKMADTDARNTINRSTFDGVISQIFEEVFLIFQGDGISPHITQQIRVFEERFRDETRGDRLERISNEVASAGLFVSDPAGGPSNLRLPHKQFYEYMISKAAWIVLAHREKMTSKLFQSVAKGKTPFEKLLAEDLSLQFFSEIIGADFSVFRRAVLYLFIFVSMLELKVTSLGPWLRTLIKKTPAEPKRYFFDQEFDGYNERRSRRFVVRSATITFATAIAVLMQVALVKYIDERSSVGSSLFSGRIFEIALLMLVMMTVLIHLVSRSSLFALWVSFQQIMYMRLKADLRPPESNVLASTLYFECFLALSNSPSSAITKKNREKLALDQSQSNAQQEFRALITPIA